MNEARRQFLRSGGGSLLLAGGLMGAWTAKQAYARDSLRRQLSAAIDPLLSPQQATELEQLPSLAREEIREYFHGICLNVHSFVAEVCSQPFTERLSASPSEAQKHDLLNGVFSRKVVTAVEVLNRVETIAGEVGSELDRNWSVCCERLATVWATPLSQHSARQQPLRLVAAVQPLILNSLRHARAQAYPVGQRPAVSDLLVDVGESALLLLPVVATSPQLAYPAFVIAALGPVWRFVIDRLTHRADGYLAAISEWVARLGNRVGDELQTEFLTRIADLHDWQREALNEAARRKAEESVPLIA